MKRGKRAQLSFEVLNKGFYRIKRGNRERERRWRLMDSKQEAKKNRMKWTCPTQSLS